MYDLTYMWTLKQNIRLTDTENRLVLARGRGQEMGEMAEGGQKAQLLVIKLIGPGDVIYSMVTTGNNTVLCIRKLREKI